MLIGLDSHLDILDIDSIHLLFCSEVSIFNPLKTSPEYTQAGVYGKCMLAISKSSIDFNRLKELWIATNSLAVFFYLSFVLSIMIYHSTTGHIQFNGRHWQGAPEQRVFVKRVHLIGRLDEPWGRQSWRERWHPNVCGLWLLGGRGQLYRG